MSLVLPTAPLATAAELAALAQKVAVNASAIAAAVTSIQNLAAQLGLDEAQIAKLVAAAQPPPVIIPPIIIPPYDPQILWKADMSTGDLSQWSEKTNSGSADSVVVQAAAEGIPARTGPWVLKQSVTGPVGGTRMQRYPEIDKLARAGTAFWYSFWAYFPASVSFGLADMFQIVSINSVDPQIVGDPIWGIFVSNTGFTPLLAWSPNARAPAEGPHAGEAGKRYYSSVTQIPVGAWTFFELYLKPAADFTGALQFYIDRNLIFDMSAVKTMFPVQPSGLPQWIDKDAYGSGLTPTPYSHMVDDVTISLGRMP